MQRKYLLRTLLIVHFAKGSARPMHSVVLRLGVAYIFAGVFGSLLARSVASVVLPTDIPLRIVLGMTLGLGFTISGLLLVTMYASQQGAQKSTTFMRVVRLLPVARPTRWLMQMIPSLIMLSIIGLFGTLLIHPIARAIQHPRNLLVAAWATGLLSGYGFVLLRWLRPLVAKGVGFVGIVSIALGLLDWTYSSQLAAAANWGPYILIVLLCLPLFGLWQKYAYGYALDQQYEQSHYRALIPQFVPYGAWFVLKLWRNSRTRSSFLLVVTLSCLTATSIVLRHKVFTDPYQVLLFGAILAGTFACEVRGVMRRYIPPEVPLLKGLPGLVMAQVGAVLLAGVLIGLPLLFALHGQTSNSFHFLVFSMCMQVFASLAGLLASTLLVPAAGETGAQFFSAMFATGLLLGFPKAAGLADVSYVAQIPYWLTVALGFGVLVYGIEIIRRKNYGRT